MRFKTFFLAGSVVLGLSQLSYGQGTIVNSKHDFSQVSNTWNFTAPVNTGYQGQICQPCHAPHSRVGAVVGNPTPLWDHALSAVTSYSLYTGAKFTNPGHGAATQTQPDGSTKLCLSCHDGTVALANFRSVSTGTTTMATFNGGAANLGTDLSTTHPISFTYDAALSSADRHLWDPTTTASGVHSGTISADMLEAGADGTMKMQCISCHDPHNAAGAQHLLIKSNVGSALCYTCHKI